MAIHSAAYVDKSAEVAESAEIEAGAYIGKNCKIGENVVIGYQAVVESYTEIGDGTVLSPNAHVGGAPQDVSYRGEDTRLVIGKNCIIREFAPIHRATTKEDWVTKVGDECYIMALSHIGHDCKFGNGVILVGSAMVAGHVHVGDYAVIGGHAGIHQFARIGTMTMVGGFGQVSRDILPYCTCGRLEGGNITGLNLVGLKRRGIKPEVRVELKKALKLFLDKSMRVEQVIPKMKELTQYDEIKTMIDFIVNTKRGVARK